MRILVPMITLLALLLGSCSGTDRSILRQADAVMEQHPDSALAILRTVDRTRLSERNLPYYALLMPPAQEKTATPVDSDSLISIA
ncbi:MAG: tetratricopeptide repeat protein, partial [Muribaculaceae bacterium]|nr:tetratricopeptide repeat protein [Muribaculaceae bacterium]